MRQRIDFRGVAFINPGDARKTVAPIDVYGATTTHSFATRATEREGGVVVSFYLQEGVENHGAATTE